MAGRAKWRPAVADLVDAYVGEPVQRLQGTPNPTPEEGLACTNRVEGQVQRSAEGVVHIIARHLEDRTHSLRALSDGAGEPPLARADEITQPYDYDGRSTVPVESAFHKGRNFH